jgi:Flp pilus assembly protein TadG
MRIINSRTRRQGTIAPLSAFLILFMLTMVAFAVDLSWIVLSQSELHNTADAAALAGANALLEDYVLYHLPNQTAARKSTIRTDAMAAARTAAKDIASYNGAGDKTSLKLRDEDIEFGFLDTSNVYTPVPTYTGYPNTVRVHMRRDDVSNGALNLYFARAVGKGSIELGADAQATLYGGVVDSFTPNRDYNGAVLPVTYDVNHWNDFVKTGKDPDGKISKDANGDPKLLVYPSIKYKGNFGLLSLDDNHAGDSEMRNWVDNGIRGSDVETLLDNKLVPLSAHPKDSWDWRGDNGFKASLVMDINDYIGKSFTFPLFQPKNSDPNNYSAGVGQGSSFDFNIVAFVGVKVVQPDKGNKEVYLQPYPVIEPEAVFRAGTLGPVQPPTSGSGLTTTFTVPKLTQ